MERTQGGSHGHVVSPASIDTTKLLDLPLEIRCLIYSHAVAPVVILPAIARTPSLRRRSNSTSNSYLHPTFPDTSLSNPLIYGIANLHSRWRVPITPFPPSQRHKVMTTAYLPSPLPHALQLVCKQIRAEFEDWAMKSGSFTFAFHRFDSLIRWVKGRGKGWAGRSMDEVNTFLQTVGSVVLEMELVVTRRTGQLVSAGGEQEDGVPDAQEPWFDGMKLLSRACPNLHVLGMHVDIRGPEIQVVHFGEAPTTAPTDSQPDAIVDTQQAAGDAATPSITHFTLPTSSTANAPTDWPPGKTQRRANLEPTIKRLLDFAESFPSLRRCGLTIRAGHVLRNLAADPGDGSLWARSWEKAAVSTETQERITRLEKGLSGVRNGSEASGDIVADLEASTRKMLAELGRDQHWY